MMQTLNEVEFFLAVSHQANEEDWVLGGARWRTVGCLCFSSGDGVAQKVNAECPFHGNDPVLPYVNVPPTALCILEVLEVENDKGFYGPKYRTAYDVMWRMRLEDRARSLSTVTKWLGYLADEGLVTSTARSGRKGGWKIRDNGRAYLAAMRVCEG